ncbi:asparagine synthetase B [Youhaiella tibetensis]|uniref:asparagine synthase (glutamine-hydrolyzing) n=1 Tax=Paradevosia tibetensis TaxID=1447062 RepID=A0A5B9DHF0_9HYPH|nr:asparagine synthase (glutamine-hydrolyzing) [Youhaiella tibetensis]QEE18731.1 asparagine synthase (glutamine-hydrolyzing) [Youhaiella tibetensis]GGF39738.1 asparagine synthetase B [Youhaiella tibetensis]
MCGITGWIGNLDRSDEAEARLRRMSDAIVHRGPDDSGFHVDDGVGFGFRRLSIVDLAGGHQPMSSQDGNIWVMLNGEVYNHEALRAEMRSQGCTFRTSSDTEVLLRLYEREGLSGFHRMNGMFGVAIWDGRTKRLHLVRDRLGVKPVYYAPVKGGLVFGSEIKAILASGLVDKEVNPRAIWDFLTFRYVPAPDSIWMGISKLPPGHVLTMELEDPLPRVERWWQMPMRAPDKSEERPDAVYDQEFADLFEDAVALRMRADVPVGITLSGGLDSSAVVSAARNSTDRLMTFSVSFAGSPETDELPYARTVARYFDTDHHEVSIGASDFMGFLTDLVWYADEPMADLASVPLYYVSKLAGQHVTVALSGEGSDEIFAGYNFEQRAQLWDRAAAARAALPRWANGRLGGLLAGISGRFARLRSDASTICDQRAVPEPISMTNYWSSADKLQLLRANGTWPDSFDRPRQILDQLGDQPPLNQALYLYSQDWLVEDLLMKADRMSMANSVELRTPFLDYRLVEWAGALPTRLKAGPSVNGVYRSKEILRRYAEARLPREIVDRPKQGFPVPVYGWLSTELKQWAQDMLSPSAQLTNWLTPEALAAVVRAGTDRTAGMMDRHRLWNVLILELWMRRWLV